jgi:hypothetical protein
LKLEGGHMGSLTSKEPLPAHPLCDFPRYGFPS